MENVKDNFSKKLIICWKSLAKGEYECTWIVSFISCFNSTAENPVIALKNNQCILILWIRMHIRVLIFVLCVIAARKLQIVTWGMFLSSDSQDSGKKGTLFYSKHCIWRHNIPGTFNCCSNNLSVFRVFFTLQSLRLKIVKYLDPLKHSSFFCTVHARSFSLVSWSSPFLIIHKFSYESRLRRFLGEWQTLNSSLIHNNSLTLSPPPPMSQNCSYFF